MRRRGRLAGALIAALTALLLLSGFVSVAGAQEDAVDVLTIREIDASDPDAVRVTFQYRGDRADLAGLTIREGGDQVEASSARPLSDDRRVAVVLLIDSSDSMNENAAIERAKEAAIAYVDGKAANEEIAVVNFGGDVTVAQDFTDDTVALKTAINEIGLTHGTLLYDGLARAAAALEERNAQPNILLLSDGADVGSSLSDDAALAAVIRSEAAVFAVGIQGESLNPRDLRRFADRTGGAYTEASDVQQLSDLFGEIQQTIARQYVVTFDSQASPDAGSLDLQLSVAGVDAQASYSPGSLTSGHRSLEPVVVEKPAGPGFVRSTLGYYLALLLLLAGVAGVAYSLITTFSRDPSALDTALQPYAEGYVASDEDAPKTGLAQAQFFKRAVALTGEIAERRGVITYIEGQLEKANLPLRAAEALFFYVSASVVVVMASLLVTRNLIVALVAVVVAVLVGPAALSFMANRRAKAFQSMLPDTLQLLASTLRAGYSLMQGVEAVSQETAEPMGRELRRVVTEARLGRPLENALDGVAERMQSGDFAWAVMAIRIQREVGGNLSELLMTVAETMTQRERLRRDVSALTAEGRISAIVLGILPVGLGFFMYVINPDYIGQLFDETLGNIMLGTSIVMALIGFYWMKKTIEIDI